MLRQLAMLLSCTALIGWLHHTLLPAPSARITCDPSQLPAEEICLSTVVNDWGNDCIWVDARRRSEWEKNGIAGSILLTTADGENFDQLLETAFPLLAEKQKRVVVYCGDLGCGMSREIAKRIRDYQLVPEVRALHGGWKALEQAGMLSRKN